MTLDYFGQLDASTESKERLAEYFYDINRGLKLDGKEDGYFIVIGVKGSGKTAICRFVQDNHESDCIVWKLDFSDMWEARSDGKSPIHYQSILTLQLLAGIYRRVLEHRDWFSDTAWAALPSATQRFAAKFASLTDGIRINANAGPLPLSIEVDIGKLISAPLHELSALTIDDFKEMLRPCLSEVPAYILIDDVDEIFPGSQDNWDFIDGLIAAASDINARFGSRLHCLIFLQAGIYNHYYMHGRGYDKHAAQAAVRLRWSQAELIQLMTKRIAVVAGLNTTDVPQWRIWQRVFDGRKDAIGDVQQYMVSRSNSGPRDLIHFANFAKTYAGAERKISLEDILAVEPDYSKDKLYLLNRDYERQHGPLATLLFRVFQGKSQTYANGELEEIIQMEMLGNIDIKEDYGNSRLVRLGDARLVMERLFEFGFLGYRTDSRAAFKYSIDTDVNPGRMLFQAYEHSIHPAYAAHLGLE